MIDLRTQKVALLTGTVALFCTCALSSELPRDFVVETPFRVSTLALTPDGKILMSGFGGPMVMLNTNGVQLLSLPTTWSKYSGQVLGFAVQTDGKILACGDFDAFNGLPLTNLVRLSRDGEVDLSFKPPYFPPESLVTAVASDSTGRLLLGGTFRALDGIEFVQLARLDMDGAFDATFPRHDPVNGGFAFHLLQDGKVLVNAAHRLLRLNADGTRDDTLPYGLPPDYVPATAVQPDGKIIIGGSFDGPTGPFTNGIHRLRPNGTFDTSFTGHADGHVGFVALQADGKILVVGSFQHLNGVPVSRFGRFNPDGTLDTSFTPPPLDISSLAVQEDGKLLIGTPFSLERLHNTGPATQHLTSDGASITWMRGGTGPEVTRVVFQYSTNNADWLDLPLPGRINGGWKLVGISLPQTCRVRARGWFTTSAVFSSQCFLETTAEVISPPAFIRDQANCGVTSGEFKFKFHGSPGQRVVVEASNDLRTWAPVSTNTLVAQPSEFSESVTSGARFYRLRSSY